MNEYKCPLLKTMCNGNSKLCYENYRECLGYKAYITQITLEIEKWGNKLEKLFSDLRELDKEKEEMEMERILEGGILA